MQLIRKKAAELAPRREAEWEALHPDVRQVIGHIHIPLLRWLVAWSYYKNVRYVDKLVAGRPCLGSIPDGASDFPPEHKPPSQSMKEWTQHPWKRNLRMIAKTKPSGDERLDWLSWEKTLAEQAKGYAKIGDLQDEDLDHVCLTPRWAKWEQKDDGTWTVRNISDWAASEGNETVEMHQRYAPDGLNVARASVRVQKELHGPEVPLASFRADYEMTFWQSPKDPAQRDQTVETCWDPEMQKVRTIRSSGQSLLVYVKNRACCHEQ